MFQSKQDGRIFIESEVIVHISIYLCVRIEINSHGSGLLLNILLAACQLLEEDK